MALESAPLVTHKRLKVGLTIEGAYPANAI